MFSRQERALMHPPRMKASASRTRLLYPNLQLRRHLPINRIHLRRRHPLIHLHHRLLLQLMDRGAPVRRRPRAAHILHHPPAAHILPQILRPEVVTAIRHRHPAVTVIRRGAVRADQAARRQTDITDRQLRSRLRSISTTPHGFKPIPPHRCPIYPVITRIILIINLLW